MAGAGLWLVTLAGCASAQQAAPPPTPDWFAESAAAREQAGFPDLASAPKTTRVITDAAHWTDVEAGLAQAAAALRANPRAQGEFPANAVEEAQAFRAEAVEQILQTRRRY